MLIKKNHFEEEKKNNYSIAIGNFDGIHKGHRFLLKELNKFKKLGTDKIGVLSFVPHPVKVLAPNIWRQNLIKFFFMIYSDSLAYHYCQDPVIRRSIFQM